MIMKTVAITGGIGSGKSVVSRLLRVEGYPVYDCDSQAKRIMDNDAEIQRQLQKAFGEDVVVDGVIHRQKLASLVFGNSENLRKLNKEMVGCRAEGFGFCRDCHPEGKWDGNAC